MKRPNIISLLACFILLLQSCQLKPDSTNDQQPNPAATIHPDATIQPSTVLTTSTPTQAAESEEKHLGALWPNDAGEIIGMAVAADGTVYVVSRDGGLQAFDMYGDEMWKYEGKYNFVSSPILIPGGDNIYLLGGKNKLVVIDKTGKEKMIFDIKGRLTSAPLISPADGSIYLQTLGDPQKMFESKVHHIFLDGTSQSFSLGMLENLSNSALASNGNIYLQTLGVIKILSSTGDVIRECKNADTGKPLSNILVGPNNIFVYMPADGNLTAKKEDCSTAWKSSIGHKKDGTPIFNLFSDESGALYAGDSDGNLYSVDINTGNTLWQSAIDKDAGHIVAMTTHKDGFIYGATSRAKIVAFDANGKKIWQDELYGIGAPTVLQAIPNGDLLVIQDNQVALYTNDPSQQHALPNPIAPPADEEQARTEVVSFVLDFIVKNEIRETADYIRADGSPWVNSPPAANIIVYAPAKDDAENSWEYLDSQNPITVWWYADDTLTEVDDKQKAIEEYQKKYIDNAVGDIFVWGSYDFGIIKIGADYRSAEIYVSASCGPLCGHGYTYKLQRSLSGKWWIYDGIHLWQS